MNFKWDGKGWSIFCLTVVFFSFFGRIPLAAASEPMEVVKGTIDEVVRILKDPALGQPGRKEERRALLEKIISARFDFTKMAKRSLAAHWRERSPAEQKEFIHLFEKLLENSYLGKIEGYTDEKVVYTRERLDGDFAEVKTKILRKGDEIPIDYRLFRIGSDWRVYDIVIDGVSLVNNYRSQFNKIIRSGSYEELVQKMRAKRDEIALTP
ncbi:MlaC/ttg2D family ABC transporter substrate-binding protein [Candidatus Manganitrophus noduliformans]|uniref:ABC transporter substrate-binding protein n=1 Tax=Candidatus Manganitrophus noduliformans TaxID=2606439 RepID=A0A7X6DN43_9BACT|nr:ABC transporter substrate-binding protein [Candidatus Manganitrophus noduliformans]NKE70291.1 ABC transporter substrate-binding protein [Candidatus Manganitrophus noduliformans]